MPYTIVPTWGGKYNGTLEAPDDYDGSVLRAYKSNATHVDYKTYEGERIDPKLVPSKLIYRGKNITDFCIVQGVHYIEVVSVKFRNLIEELEPDVHQFIPVQINRPDGTQVDGEFYYLNVLQVAYTIDVENSPRAHWRVNDATGNFIGSIQMMPSRPDPDVIYFTDKVGQMHLWQERYLKWCDGRPKWMLNVSGRTVSDALMKRMKREKIYSYRITFKGVLDNE